MGFGVRNALLRMIESPTGGTERLLTLRLSTADGLVNLVCIYSPTLNSPGEVKGQFNESLDAAIGKIPFSEHIFLLGDFKTRVGAERNSRPSILGHHGIGKMNENGQRLLELCCYHSLGLCVGNTFFQNKACHKGSWRHPRPKHCFQLDLIVTKHDLLDNICNTRAYHIANCDTDHSLIASGVKLRSKKLRHSKKKGQPGINNSKLSLQHHIQHSGVSV